MPTARVSTWVSRPVTTSSFPAAADLRLISAATVWSAVSAESFPARQRYTRLSPTWPITAVGSSSSRSAIIATVVAICL